MQIFEGCVLKEQGNHLQRLFECRSHCRQAGELEIEMSNMIPHNCTAHVFRVQEIIKCLNIFTMVLPKYLCCSLSQATFPLLLYCTDRSRLSPNARTTVKRAFWDVLSSTGSFAIAMIRSSPHRAVFNRSSQRWRSSLLWWS